MFKKRGRFKQNQRQTEGFNQGQIQDSNTLIASNNNKDGVEDVDEDIDEISMPELKKCKNVNNITFRKKKLLVNHNHSAVNYNDNDNDSYNDDNDSAWYNDNTNENLVDYYNQFDDSSYNDNTNESETEKIDNKSNNSNDFNELSNSEAQILVHRLTPPFLDSKSILSSNNQIIDVIKDKSGDLYKYSKNGSSLVNEKRELLDREQNSKQNILNKDAIHKVINNDQANDNDDNDDKLETTDNGDNDNDNKNDEIFDIKSKINLPAYKVRDQLIKLINENQVIIVIGETGSGKSTQLPQILYDNGYHNNGLIGITQPRRMAAISVSKRVSKEMNVNIGNEVGYSIRFNDLTSNLTKIKFMTDGVLLRETLNDSNLNKYSCIIMDEAHERSLNTDILFGIFKKILSKRRDFKLIITSATMNSLKFSKFFNNAIQFKIPGKTFPVDIMYQSIPSIDYVDSAVKQALKIHLSNPINKKTNNNSDISGDILIFMTGQEDIEFTCQLINEELLKLKKLNPDIKDLNILPVYSNLSSIAQSKIFKDSINRKCIVATNIAETSLTLKNVKFVIDSGLMKLKVFNPKLNMDSLQIVPISKAQANQRSGRAGRTCPGQSFRLFTLSSYEDEMWDEPIPEIQRSNLMNTILLLKNLNINDITKFPFIDKPSIESIETSQYELWSIGALDNFGYLTNLGKKMSNFPIDPTLSKMLIISNLLKFSCCEEIIKIVSMLSVPQIFTKPKKDSNLQKKIDQVREHFQIEDSDHLTLLNIFNQYCNITNNMKEKWCNKNYFNFKSLRNAFEIYSQLKQLVEKSLKKNDYIKSCKDDWNVIKECICASFYSNAAEFYKHGQYKHCRTGLEMYINKTSSLNGVGDLPKYVVFHELLLTGQKQQMNYITSVEGDWLLKYGNVFYSKKVRGVNSRENQHLKEKQFQQLIEVEREKLSQKKN